MQSSPKGGAVLKSLGTPALVKVLSSCFFIKIKESPSSNIGKTQFLPPLHLKSKIMDLPSKSFHQKDFPGYH